MTRPAGATIPHYWSSPWYLTWGWVPKARTRWARFWVLNAIDPIGYTGA